MTDLFLIIIIFYLYMIHEELANYDIVEETDEDKQV